MDSSMASPYKSLQICVKHFSWYLRYEVLLWREAWRGSLHNYLPPFISQILGFMYCTVLILIYFERRETENQQLNSSRRLYSRLLAVFVISRYIIDLSRFKIKPKCSLFFCNCTVVIIIALTFLQPFWIPQLGPAHCGFVERRLLFGSVPLHLTTSRTVSLRNTSQNHAYFEVCTLLHTRPTKTSLLYSYPEESTSRKDLIKFSSWLTNKIVGKIVCGMF